jgi:hypothetical protein
MRVLRSRLYEMEQQKQQAALAKERKAMVGSGDRSEKIRTYNFPQNRVTDHRIGFTVHQLDQVMEGKLQPLRTRHRRRGLVRRPLQPQRQLAARGIAASTSPSFTPPDQSFSLSFGRLSTR